MVSLTLVFTFNLCKDPRSLGGSCSDGGDQDYLQDFFLIFVDKTCFVLQHTCPLCPQVPAVMRSQ